MYPYTIREAVHSDLGRIMQLEIKVTFEFFHPLMASIYKYDFPTAPQNLALHDVSNGLQKNVIAYEKVLIQKQCDKRVIAAFNDVTHECIGMLYVTQRQNCIFLELLCLEKSHRNQGIGKQLLEHAYKLFPTAEYCLATTHKHSSNNSAITAYKKLGFDAHECMPLEFDHIFSRIIVINHPNGNTYTRSTNGHVLFLVKKLHR